MSADQDRGELLRKIAAVVGNVGVVTALLVYFGWVRSEVQAAELGFDESVLGMTTREYLLRSVRPVLVLLIVAGAAGLMWVGLDHWLSRRLELGDRRAKRVAVYAVPALAVVLPASAWILRPVWPATAYVAFPLLLATGLLLLLYAFRLYRARSGAPPLSHAAGNLLRACAAALVGVALFSAAANYATVEGTELARGFGERIAQLPRVVVHSADPLGIDAPGAAVEELPEGAGYRYRYTGLRLLEHTGGRYFLVSDGWTRRYGVIVVLPSDEPGIRYDFVRDTR
ncbi:hypothetical protein ACQ3I4_07340 [Zafaria sp. Z1313]|uniref:hypothetical protein n=1 Tax=unclassified Zafaria TaxID=2828765 RepID=UPI002E7912CC|nr:hypothetical protein [Zafaria sp. J156]MEE1620361.1 hypothetical protein [Zafaria sp. J156]